MSKAAFLVGIIVGMIVLGMVMSVVSNTHPAAEVACNNELEGDGWEADGTIQNAENKSVTVKCAKENRTEYITTELPEIDWVQ